MLDIAILSMTCLIKCVPNKVEDLNLNVLLYWSEFKYEFIGFALSSFTLNGVNSKVF